MTYFLDSYFFHPLQLKKRKNVEYLLSDCSERLQLQQEEEAIEVGLAVPSGLLVVEWPESASTGWLSGELSNAAVEEPRSWKAPTAWRPSLTDCCTDMGSRPLLTWPSSSASDSTRPESAHTKSQKLISVKFDFIIHKKLYVRCFWTLLLERSFYINFFLLLLFLGISGNFLLRLWTTTGCHTFGAGRHGASSSSSPVSPLIIWKTKTSQGVK